MEKFEIPDFPEKKTISRQVPLTSFRAPTFLDFAFIKRCPSLDARSILSSKTPSNNPLRFLLLFTAAAPSSSPLLLLLWSLLSMEEKKYSERWEVPLVTTLLLIVEIFKWKNLVCRKKQKD